MGIRPPVSLTRPSLSIKSDGRNTKLLMHFETQENQGKVGLLVDGELYWVDLSSVGQLPAQAQQNTPDSATAPIAPTDSPPEDPSESLRVVGARITGRPVVGEIIGVDFTVLSSNRKDPLARTRISWLSGERRELVGTGKSYLLHAEDKNQPLFALITPVSRSGVRGQSTEVAIPFVVENIKDLAQTPATPSSPLIPAQRIWSIPIGVVVNGKQQILTVTMNASGYLSQNDVEAVVKNTFSAGVNTQTLRALVNSMDQLYIAKKLPSFKTLVPEQNFALGTIQLTLMEPVIGNLSMSGVDSGNYLNMVANRIGIKSGELLNVEAIDEKVQIFNMRNRGKTRMLLEPGEGLGESDVHIEITPPPKAEITANYNNTGSEQTGRQMYSLRGTLYGQLFGTEVIGLSRVQSRTLSVNSASIDLPMVDSDFLLGAGRTDVNNQPIDNPVDVNSKSSTSYFQVTKPIIFSSVESIDFSLRASKVNNGTSYLGQTLNSNTVANKATFGTSYAAYLNNSWSHSKMSTDIQLTRIDTQTVSIANDIADNSVNKLTYNTVYQLDLNSGWGGKAELNAQPLKTVMPSADKFVVGMDNVRAYKPGSAIGDTGMSFNLDLFRSTYFEVDNVGTKVMTQPYVFYDTAVVYDLSNANASQTFKAGGYGIKMPIYSAYKGYSFDFYQAWALAGSANKPAGSRLGISVNYVY